MQTRYFPALRHAQPLRLLAAWFKNDEERFAQRPALKVSVELGKEAFHASIGVNFCEISTSEDQHALQPLNVVNRRYESQRPILIN
jgi:hypothetical protein